MVGVVIVTHGQVGLEMLRTAQEIVGRIERAEAVTIEAAEKIERARTKIEAAIKRVSTGAGVLILTDMFGGTPSNLGLSFLDKGALEVVTGVNLPMLIKLPSLREGTSLRELADRLSKYGQKNILVASEFLAKKAAGPAGPA
ncbi:MAG: PTS fructose transporter subunit IIA [candidate division NC10 bacterium]|nr:PTS fructose transporter subunit IIA [candidate division NC10 bacterium]MBI4413406.1 PTS fructose transporter subunit IIA [candidate division NC10 bacterium]